jgi:biotin transport system substrate-specific component
VSTLTLAFGRPTLADRIFSRSLAIDVVLIAAGAALTAIAAQAVVPLWPVPMTLQTFAVLLVGTTLGPVRGALSMGLYLLIGILGLPVFADGASGSLFALTSGGFIIGFIVAAALVGWLAQREWDRRFVGTLVSFLAGSAVMYLFGLPWLYSSLANLGPAVWQDYLGYDSVLAATIGAGVLPFLLGDLLKALLAGALLPIAWRGVNRLQREKKAE